LEVIKTLGMKTFHGSPRRRAARTGAAQRVQLLAAFDHSGLSASAFARQHGIHYTTFCGWRHQRRDQGEASPGFVQVELPESATPVELVIALGATARLRLTAEAQIPLAARLLQTLNASRPC
jgi:transposase-like protein